MNITSNQDHAFVLEALGSSEKAKLVESQRLLPERKQMFYIVYFTSIKTGLTDYAIISAHDDEREAQAECALISRFAEVKAEAYDIWKMESWSDKIEYYTETPQHLVIPGVTEQAQGNRFSVCTQTMLDGFAFASTYRSR